MKRIIIFCLAASFGFGSITGLLYKQYGSDLFFSLAITCFTTFYHVAMRLIIGGITPVFRRRCRKKDALPFHIGDRETAFYKMIRIKQWKRYAPTYNRKLFDISENSYDALCHNMANAQVGHGLMVVLSFVPLLFSHVVNGFWPFCITSVLAALFDMQFVMIQRYNRARVSHIRSQMNERAVRLNRQQGGGKTSSLLPV